MYRHKPLHWPVRLCRGPGNAQNMHGSRASRVIMTLHLSQFCSNHPKAKLPRDKGAANTSVSRACCSNVAVASVCSARVRPAAAPAGHVPEVSTMSLIRPDPGSDTSTEQLARHCTP